MSPEKMKIIEANYNIEEKLAKVTVQNIDSEEKVTWAMTGDSFDAFVAQITGTPLKYYDEQREILCQYIPGIEFVNDVQVELSNQNLEDVKDKSLQELKSYHNVIDRYPFYEINKEIEESSE